MAKEMPTARRLYVFAILAYSHRMSTITAIFEPDSDGTLHLPLPAAWRNLPIRVKAELEPATEELPTPQPGSLKGFGCLSGKISMSADFDEPLDDFKEYMA